MYRIYLFLLSCFVFQDLAAQKKFFKSIELLPYIYYDDALYTSLDFGDLYRKPDVPLSGNRLDSLNSVFEKHSYANGGKGVQIRLQKILPFFSPNSRRQIEWHIGAGYRTYRFRSLTYSRYYVWDTASPNLMESEQFRLEEKYTDLYSSIVYSIYGRSTPGLTVTLGFGIQASFAVGPNSIIERYSARKISWNGTSWEEKDKLDTLRNAVAIKKTLFSWNIPLGLRFRISKKISAGCSFEYFHRRKKPSHQKTYSEGILFMPAIRYNL